MAYDSATIARSEVYLFVHIHNRNYSVQPATLFEAIFAHNAIPTRFFILTKPTDGKLKDRRGRDTYSFYNWDFSFLCSDDIRVFFRIADMKFRRMETARVVYGNKLYSAGGYDYRTGRINCPLT